MDSTRGREVRRHSVTKSSSRGRTYTQHRRLLKSEDGEKNEPLATMGSGRRVNGAFLPSHHRAPPTNVMKSCGPFSILISRAATRSLTESTLCKPSALCADLFSQRIQGGSYFSRAGSKRRPPTPAAAASRTPPRRQGTLFRCDGKAPRVSFGRVP